MESGWHPSMESDWLQYVIQRVACFEAAICPICDRSSATKSREDDFPGSICGVGTCACKNCFKITDTYELAGSQIRMSWLNTCLIGNIPKRSRYIHSRPDPPSWLESPVQVAPDPPSWLEAAPPVNRMMRMCHQARHDANGNGTAYRL